MVFIRLFICLFQAIEENQLNFTRDFVENIAELLETHKADAQKLENLLELVLFFGTSTVVEEHKQEVRKGKERREGRREERGIVAYHYILINRISFRS